MNSNVFDTCTPNNLIDLILMSKDIISIAEQYPIEDKVFILPMYSYVKKYTGDVTYCIAGSKAITFIHKLLIHEQTKLVDKCKIYGDFNANDTDIFFLGSKDQHRLVYGNTDIVHVREKTVESLILNFDLNCCRCAFNEDHETLWISAQCVNSLFTGKYYLPNYLQDKTEFLQLMKLNNLQEDKIISLFHRLNYRKLKYETRGYQCINFNTDVTIPWIRHRFFYGNIAV